MEVRLLFILVVGFNTLLFAQQGIKGSVISSETGEPIVGASVYISNTSYGVATDLNGDFILSETLELPFYLNISAIGYKTEVIHITTFQDSLLNISLESNVVELNAVTVYGDKEKQWEKFGVDFTKLFIGYSDFAEECVIENKEDIIFQYDEENLRLSAFSKKSLIIKNNALGYKITYWLEAFEYSYKTRGLYYEGYPFFKNRINEKIP